MKKILFTDLDGTLLSSDKTVSKANREAIGRLLDAGNYLVVATGRPVKTGFDVVRSLGLTMPGCYMIAFNGAVLYDCAADRILKQYTLSIEDVEYLFEEAKQWGLHIQTYQDNYLLTERYTPELEFYTKNSAMDCKVVPNIFSILDGEPNKVLLASLDDEKKLLDFQKAHLEWEKGRCNSFFSCREYLEYCPEGIDKGSGIGMLAEFLNIPLRDTYAVGDERNDIPMLLAAGTGIAMKNGHCQVQHAADYVTRHDNDQDAIAEIVEQFGLYA